MTTLAQEMLREREQRFERALGEARAINRRKVELEIEVSDLTGSVEVHAKVAALFTQMSQDVQTRFLRQVEALVTAGLRAVFREDMTFTITPAVRRNTVELDFGLKVGDAEADTDLMASHGGGVVTLCGVILRLITVRLLGEEAVRQVVILDEPLAMLSERYVEPAAAFLSKVARDLDVQVLMVSHQPEFAEAADKVFRLERQDGKLVVS